MVHGEGTLTRRGEWEERRGKMEKEEGVRSTSARGERYATAMRLTSMVRQKLVDEWSIDANVRKCKIQHPF